MQSRDYFERLIEQLAAAVGRIAGLASQGQLEEADRELDSLWLSSLGMRRSDAARLDDASLRAMLGPKTPLAGQLLEAQAAIDDARGATSSAAALRARAGRLASGH